MMRWNSDSSKLVVIGQFNEAIVWDVVGHKRIAQLLTHTVIGRIYLSTLDYPIEHLVAWRSSGDAIAVIDTLGNINILDTNTGDLILQVGDPFQLFTADIAWQPDGSFLAARGTHAETKLYIWNIIISEKSATSVATIGFEDDVSNILWSSAGQHLIGSSMDGTIRIWDAATQVTSIINTRDFCVGCYNDVFGVLLSPDNSKIVSYETGSGPYYTNVWDVKTGLPIQDYIVRGHDYLSRVDHWSADSQQLWSLTWQPHATCSYDTNQTLICQHNLFLSLDRLYPQNETNHLYILDLEEAVTSITWSPDAARFAGSGEDGQTHIWDVATGEVLLTLDNAQSVIWSPDSRKIAQVDDGVLFIWERSR